MHTFQLNTTSPTHRRLSDSASGILRELPPGTATTRPVDPADFEVMESAENTYQATIAAGYCVTDGYCLGMTPEDRSNWAQMLVLFREAEALGAMTGESEVEFWDKGGTRRTVTLAEFRSMILGLGQAVVTAETARRA